MKKTLRAAVAALFVSATPVAAAPVQNEIMFMLDSSGGLYDSAFANWNAQIGWVQNFIDQTHRADGSNAYGIMTFAGRPSSASPAQNLTDGGVSVLHGLWAGTTNPNQVDPSTPSSEQNPADLNDFTSGITNDDFLSGHTRTTEALHFVYEQFLAFSNSTTNKYIFMLTDGGFTPGFLPADPSDGFVSQELENLRATGFSIAAVAVSGFAGIEIDNLSAMISDPSLLFSVDGSDDFSDFLPAAQVAVPAPPALALFGGGLAFLALHKRRIAGLTDPIRRHKTVT